MDRAELTLLRKSESSQRTVTVAAVSTPLAPRNDRRIGIVVSADETNDIWLSMGQAAAVGVGILIPARQYPFFISIEQYGSMLMADLFAIAIAGTASVTVWETSLPL